MDPLAALLNERPPPQLSATELHSRIALLEDAARAYRAELESRTTTLDALPDEIQQLIFGKLCNALDPRAAVDYSSASKGLRELMQRVGEGAGKSLLQQLKEENAAAAVGAESMSWAIATKLGASTAEDSDRAYVLCDHRWRWFAGAPREWREKFEELVQERLHENLWEFWKRKGMTPITENTPWEEAGPLYDPKSEAFNALFEDRGSLAALKERVVELRNLGEVGCRENDQRYEEHEGEWVLDLVLDTIVGVTDAQEVDEQYESDASSCEFGEPDPYDQFRPLEIADFDVYDSDESWAAHREAVGLGHLNERIFPVLGL